MICLWVPPVSYTHLDVYKETDTIEEAVNAMGPPVGKTYIPSQSASVVYDALFEMYREMYLYLGKDSSMLKRLAAMRGKEK